MAAGPGARLTMKLNLRRLALLLSLAQQRQHHPPGTPGSHRRRRSRVQPVPLFELVTAAVSVDLHDLGAGWVEATAATHLQLDVFSSSKQGWEPVLEPWQCR